MSDLETSQISPEKRKVRRRPMLLLSKSKAVQTEPVDFGTSTDSDLFSPVSDSFINPHLHRNRPSISPSISTTTSDLEPRPALSHTDSLTSSPTLPPYTSAGGLSSESGPGTVDPRSLALHSLIEYMSRLLLKISQSDVQTLTKRLKRQHLPGDVGHLSKSTLNSIISEVNELRNHFRTVLETERKQDLLAQSAGEKERQFESQVTRKVGVADPSNILAGADPFPLRTTGLPRSRQALQGHFHRAVFAPVVRQRGRSRPVQCVQAPRTSFGRRGSRSHPTAAQDCSQLVRPGLDLRTHLKVLHHSACGELGR